MGTKIGEIPVKSRSDSRHTVSPEYVDPLFTVIAKLLSSSGKVIIRSPSEILAHNSNKDERRSEEAKSIIKVAFTNQKRKN